MPLDTSSYSLALLRLDGRRWNELRRIHAVISSQPAADGSSYLEMGNTKVICTVTGPSEQKRTGPQQPTGPTASARIDVEVSVAGFSSVDRKKRSRTDKRTAEMQHILVSALSDIVHTHLYPHSTILISLHVLSLDGGLLAALINASTLALVDAGIPMSDYLVACTTGSTVNNASSRAVPARQTIPGIRSMANEVDDPLLDLNGLEEQDLPFVTVATVGSEKGRVAVCFSETRMMAERLEEMLAVGVDGCQMIRKVLDASVKAHGRRMLDDT
ncbi:ribosomal protein S5 domain 2-like protein [Microthyrium microscopicum]|uniref:Ribosomal protein S5 domain 2-like protein n=1 Tax=Microthyrium microscopicum TaxID=703497 RepID=A0A6A6UCW7_9PEZI|nr:ribosomal protein S5 domain 2-like protein [Microthyrium microscopicum]